MLRKELDPLVIPTNGSPAPKREALVRPSICLRGVTLLRRTQEELTYDLKRNLFALVEGRYRRPASKAVLRNINLEVPPGEKVGVIGANGAGKSTLLKMICGILRPSKGTVEVRGSIAPLIELGAGFDPELSVFDNVILYGILLGSSKASMLERAPGILAFAELESYASMPVKTLSSGMTARLGFAIASDVDPDVLILDEVLSIGDEHFRNKCRRRLEHFWHKDATIITVSHDLAFIRESCTRVVCMEEGRLAFEGPTAAAIRFYLDTVSEADSLHRGE